MRGNEHSRDLLNADQARRDLVDDLRNMNTAGGNLIRRGEQTLKRTVLSHGAAVLGGLIIGVALNRLATGRRGSFVVGALVNRAAGALATTLASQLVIAFFPKRSEAP